MKNLFHTPVVKSGVPNFDPVFSSGYPSFFFDNSPFSAMRTRPGANHPWVYAAVSTIIRNYIQSPIRMYDIADPDTLIEDHPVLDLLRRPNPSMSGTNFIESICWNLCLPTKMTPGGQAFIWGDSHTNFRRGDIPDELWVQNDAGVSERMTFQKILAGWHFERTDTSPYDYVKMDLLLDEVIRVNYFNPYAINRGLAPGYPLRVAVAQDANAAEFNTTFMGNNSGIQGVFTSKTPMHGQQLDEAKKNWDKYYRGARNAGQNAWIPWDVSFEKLGLSPADAQYLESMGWNRDQVCAAFQVSKLALQDYESINMATAKVAKQQLYDNAIIPMNNLIMEELNEAWIERIDRGQWRICVDFSGVAALRDDRDLNWKCAEIAVMLGIPPIIALKMNNIPTDDLDERKMPWLMQNQGPTAAFQAEPDKAPPKEPKKALTIHKVMTREEKDQLSEDYIEKVLNPGERGLVPSLRKYFNTERNRTLDMVDDWEKTGRSPKNTEPGSFMLDRTREDMLLRGLMFPHYKAQADRAGADIGPKIAAVKKTQKDLGQEATELEIRDWIQRRLQFISEVNTTTFDGLEEELAKVLAKSITDELSTAATAKAIKEGIREVYTTRVNGVKNIARTEMGSVTTYVANTAMKNAKIEKKAWIASKDEFGFDSNVRHTHRLADEEGPIPFDQAFNNGLMFPMESGAPAKEVCQCRCHHEPVGDDDPFKESK